MLSTFRVHFTDLKSIRVIILMIFTELYIFCSFAAADYTIVTADLPPWSINGETGIFPDIVAEIEKRLGTGHRPRELPWSRAQKYAMKNDNYLIFPLTRTVDREKQFTWIIEVMSYTMLFITVGGDPVDLETARSLKTILVHQDAPPYYVLDRKGFKNLDPHPYGAAPLAKMLVGGHGDAWFSDRNFAKYCVKGTPYEGKLVFGPPISEHQLYIAGSLNMAPDIVTAYRKAYKEIRTEGIVDKIMIKYLGE